MKNFDLIKQMNIEQMANLFMETKVKAIEKVLNKFGLYEPVSQHTREKVKEEIIQFLESEA